MKKDKLFIICLFLTPIPFFLLNYFIFNHNNDSLMGGIIGAILCGYGGSIGIWLLYKKRKKE